MASFIYLYSKFTEELLLLSAAGIFALASFYCYIWVVKKRRLGAARDQVPAGMVKIYLNQLINEAQFVRTQLFGLIAGGASPENLMAHFQGQATTPLTSATPGNYTAPAPTAGAAAPAAGTGEIPKDLMERLKALETQLAEKESMVVNINVEKTKLLEEVENLKQNEKVTGAAPAAPSGNNDDLIQKIKALEERLEEYALFEDDLANLKRLQQENTSLKKQLESGAPASSSSSSSTPAVEASSRTSMPKDEPSIEPMQNPALDQAAVDALLDGKPAVPPHASKSEKAEKAEAAASAASTKPEAKEAGEKGAEAPEATVTPISAKAKTPEAESVTPPPAPEAKKKADAPKTGDGFESLVDEVEQSISTKPEEKAAAPAAQVATAAPAKEEQLAAPSEASKSLADKSDEELLKEFENLLNS